MDSNKKSIELRLAPSEAEGSQKTTERREKTEVRSQKREGERQFWLLAAPGILTILLAIVFSPSSRAQFSTGGTAVLGDFLNPQNITVGADTCSYDLLQIDLAQGKVFARPFFSVNNVPCASTALQDVTSLVFTIPPTSPFLDGLIDVGDFTLQGTVDAFFRGVTLNFVPNPDNTPVIIRATGNVTINSSTTLSVAGKAGAVATSFVRGAGGAGGPGGYRGGDGGTGGILSPTAGSPGAGPGGGPGGGIGGSNPSAGAKFLTTGTTVGGTVIPAGNDVVTLLRGGSGGGGGGGRTDRASDGGGGGGGAILIAADNTITINGTVTARGGNNGCCFGSRGSGGTGGMIRLVASTIAGNGALNADNGCNVCQATSANGIIRSEAFTLAFSGTLTGDATAFSEPGPIVAPSVPTAFIQFATLTDTNNAANTVAVAPASQATPGRTGILNASGGIVGQTEVLNAADVTLPNPAGPASSVTVDLIAGPNTGPPNGFPAGKTVTLVVTPLDPAQGASASFTAPIICPAPTAPCTASVTGVTLPLGFSSMSAFTVLSIDAAGALARMFPKMYEGEPIESVRLQTDGKETEYVLIARSGREFPYKPGR